MLVLGEHREVWLDLPPVLHPVTQPQGTMSPVRQLSLKRVGKTLKRYCMGWLLYPTWHTLGFFRGPTLPFSVTFWGMERRRLLGNSLFPTKPNASPQGPSLSASTHDYAGKWHLGNQGTVVWGPLCTASTESKVVPMDARAWGCQQASTK